MTTTFETAKIGDRVWSVEYGWGVIQSVLHAYVNLIQVKFAGDFCIAFSLSGSQLPWCETQTLFWDEVVIKVPVKPLPELEIDTKVLVWNDPSEKHRRHFSHFSNDGRVHTFDAGSTSFSKLHRNSVTGWDYWELAE